MSRPRLHAVTVSGPDGALGPVEDQETEVRAARLDPGDTDQLQQLLTSLRAWALEDGLPSSDTMRRTVAMVLDGRHAPAAAQDLDVLITTCTQYLAYLVDVLTPARASLPSSATPVAELVRRATALLAEDRPPANRRRDVVRLAGAVGDLMSTVEEVVSCAVTGSHTPTGPAITSVHS
ncbi:hypothetical protein ACFC7A_19405 [Streptomyces niveus]|uniref:hypothetical protein n=1 Tax=Streptomyces niveus TaxID=193462 RepID=UPI0035DA2F43